VEIQPASLAVAQRGRNGQLVTIEEDVLNIAQQLREIDPCLSLHWNEGRGVFVVLETLENGDEKLVTVVKEVDQRLVERIRKIASADYDYVKELDMIDAAHDRKIEHDFSEKVGEAGERMYHALKPKGRRIFVPDWCRR
jgi:hypothetical protein